MKKILLFVLIFLGARCYSQNQEPFIKWTHSVPLQFVDREKDPYQVTGFSIDERSVSFLDKYDLTKFNRVQCVEIGFMTDSMLPVILQKLLLLPSLKALEFAEYPIFPPRDRNFLHKKFPDEIKLFTKLRAVRFSLFKNYDWDDILTKLADLHVLNQLDITLSYFNEIPSALRKLNSLQCLTIRDNELIKTLPVWFTEFKKLEKLNIGQNPKLDYATAFTVLATMPGLRILELPQTIFDSIPASFADLRSLQSISGIGLKLTNWKFFFSALGNMPALRELFLRGNDSMYLPHEIGELKKLEVLSLESQGISILPDEIGKLTALKELLLAGNKLRVLPFSFFKLTGLRKLDLSYNDLQSIPEEIGLLYHLGYLNLMHNKLTALPEGLKKPGSSDTLLLSGNPLVLLPEGIPFPAGNAQKN